MAAESATDRPARQGGHPAPEKRPFYRPPIRPWSGPKCGGTTAARTAAQTPLRRPHGRCPTRCRAATGARPRKPPFARVPRADLPRAIRALGAATARAGRAHCARTARPASAKTASLRVELRNTGSSTKTATLCPLRGLAEASQARRRGFALGSRRRGLGPGNGFKSARNDAANPRVELEVVLSLGRAPPEHHLGTRAGGAQDFQAPPEAPLFRNGWIVRVTACVRLR